MATDLDGARRHLSTLDHLSRRIIGYTYITLAICTVAVILAAHGLSTGAHTGWWTFVLFCACLGLVTDSRRLAFEEGRMAEREAMWYWDELIDDNERLD